MDKKWLEQRLVAEIEQQYTSPEKIDELVKSISASVVDSNRDLNKSIDGMDTQLKTCNLEIKRLLDAIKSG